MCAYAHGSEEARKTPLAVCRRAYNFLFVCFLFALRGYVQFQKYHEPSKPVSSDPRENIFSLAVCTTCCPLGTCWLTYVRGVVCNTCCPVGHMLVHI